MRPPLRRLAVACAAVLTLTATACSEDSEGIDGLTVSGDFGKEATVEVDGLDVDAAESEVVIQGDGDKVTADAAALYRFAIAKGADGEQVAGNYQDEEPQKMVIAEQPEAIKEAVTDQRIGSRVAVAMPVKDLLGEQGAPQAGLDADDDLVIVFDLMELAEAPLSGPEGTKVEPPKHAPKVVEEDGDVASLDFSSAPAKAPGQLQVIPLVEGEGEAIKEGDQVTVDYYAAVWGKEDEPFDNSFTGDPATFTITQGGLIDGWVEGLVGVKEGSRVMLVIPPDLGYGPQGNGSDIPGNATLVFVIDVLQVGA